jgi:hypothetical protein
MPPLFVYFPENVTSCLGLKSLQLLITVNFMKINRQSDIHLPFVLFRFLFIGHYICPLTWESPPEFTYLVLLLFTRVRGEGGQEYTEASNRGSDGHQSNAHKHPYARNRTTSVNITFPAYFFYLLGLCVLVCVYWGLFWNNERFNSGDCVTLNETGTLPWMVTR